MKERMLILCYRAPYPLKSGSEIRMYQFIEVLSKFFDIDVAYLSEQKDEVNINELKEMVHDVKRFHVGKIRRLIQSVLGYAFRTQPLQIGYFYSKEMQQWICENVHKYHRIVSMHIRTFSYIEGIPQAILEGKKIYLDGIDAISLNYHNSYLTSRGWKRLVYKLESKRLGAYEKKAYSYVQHTSLISQRDKEYLTSHLDVAHNAHVIYNYAIDLGYCPDAKKSARMISFMGKMNYAPNIDAVLHFIKNVYPSVKKKNPDLEFYIIGGHATKELMQYDGKMGIHFLGFVEKPAQVLQKSALVIAPMISGSGLQNKILQAMFLGCAVLTTKIGADGMESAEKEDIIIVEDDEEMIAQMNRYMLDSMQEKRDQIGQNARRYVMEHYSYEAIEKQILEWMEEA